MVQLSPSSLVGYTERIRSAWSSPWSSRCSQAHIRQVEPSRVTTTSFQAETSLPGSTTVRRPVCRSAASPPAGVSTASTHQCFDPGVEQLTYNRQPPSGRLISAGRSSDALSKVDASTVATVSKCTPSVDRATTFAYPRP